MKIPRFLGIPSLDRRALDSYHSGVGTNSKISGADKKKEISMSAGSLTSLPIRRRSEVQLNVHVPPDLRNRFKAACDWQGTSMRDQITQFMEQKVREFQSRQH